MTDRDRKILLTLHPIVAARASNVLYRCEQAGIACGLFSGLREFYEQHDLFKNGRTLINGIWVITDRSKIVTYSDAGGSFHEYGLAIDLVQKKHINAKIIDFTWDSFVDNNKDLINDWDQVGKIAEDEGFFWGKRFKNIVDLPHFQYTCGLDIKQVQFIYSTSGMSGVWETITQLSKIT